MTAQLNRERLVEISNWNQHYEPVSYDEAKVMARMLLAGMDSKPYWWAIENRHGDARFVEGEHTQNDIWDEVHELNEKDDAGEYFDSDAPYKVVPVFRHAAPPAAATVPDVLGIIERHAERLEKDGRAAEGFAEDQRKRYAAAMLRGVVREYRAATQSLGNSEQLKAEPVTAAYTLPDGWIKCSERMPKDMSTVIVSNGADIGWMWWDGDNWKSWHEHDSVPEDVTHWMQLPAAPEQEV